jgi:hypothetical protein
MWKYNCFFWGGEQVEWCRVKGEGKGEVMYENRIMKPTETMKRRSKKSNGGGKCDQSTLCACVEMSQWSSFVWLIYRKKRTWLLISRQLKVVRESQSWVQSTGHLLKGHGCRAALSCSGHTPCDCWAPGTQTLGIGTWVWNMPWISKVPFGKKNVKYLKIFMLITWLIDNF